MADEILRSRHGFGNLVDVIKALEAGKIDAHDILFLDGDTEPKIGWIDKNGNFRLVKNECVVPIEDTLPEIGVVGKIYIFEEDAYFWNGEKFVNLCKSTDLTEFEARMNEIESVIVDLKSEIESKVSAEEVQVKIDESISTINAYIDEKIEVVSSEHIVKKYEITDAPVGTLVDYRDDEIRIMCPSNAVFTKQNVGEGGDANSYYVTFKVYAPNDNAVGYIEHLGGTSDSEILTDLKTDKYGRRYQPTWLAVAKYDEATGVWNYYGKNSVAEKYIGWDYRIDWYDVNGTMIISDSVRIGLSNEDCHFVNEPYYVNSIMKDVEAKIEEKIEEVQVGYEIIEF